MMAPKTTAPSTPRITREKNLELMISDNDVLTSAPFVSPSIEELFFSEH